MNDFYLKISEAFPCYHCCLYEKDEISFTPNHFFNATFKIESFVTDLDDFFKSNTCPYEHVCILFKILIKDQFNECNCYGFLIPKSGIDEVVVHSLQIKDFNKDVVIDQVMKDVNKESFMHIVDIDVAFSWWRHYVKTLHCHIGPVILIFG